MRGEEEIRELGALWSVALVRLAAGMNPDTRLILAAQLDLLSWLIHPPESPSSQAIEENRRRIQHHLATQPLPPVPGAPAGGAPAGVVGKNPPKQRRLSGGATLRVVGPDGEEK